MPIPPALPRWMEMTKLVAGVCTAIGGLSVAKNGMRDPGYDEAALTPHMQGREIDIAVDVGMGRGRATVWTCDLTHRYIDINGSYRS